MNILGALFFGGEQNENIFAGAKNNEQQRHRDGCVIRDVTFASEKKCSRFGSSCVCDKIIIKSNENDAFVQLLYLHSNRLFFGPNSH